MFRKEAAAAESSHARAEHKRGPVPAVNHPETCAADRVYRTPEQNYPPGPARWDHRAFRYLTRFQDPVALARDGRTETTPRFAFIVPESQSPEMHLPGVGRKSSRDGTLSDA